jgi:hypothetical protein
MGIISRIVSSNDEDDDDDDDDVDDDNDDDNNNNNNTDREVTANRPGIIIKNKKEKTCTLMMWQYPQTEMLCKRKRKRS